MLWSVMRTILWDWRDSDERKDQFQRIGSHSWSLEPEIGQAKSEFF